MSIEELSASALLASCENAKTNALLTSEHYQQQLAARIASDLRKFTTDEKARFVDELRAVPNVDRACRLVGISRAAAVKAQQSDALFAAQWYEALASHIDDVEAAMFERAKNPTAQNTVAGIFLMKSWQRERYGEHIKVEHDHAVDVVVHLNRPAPRKLGEPNKELSTEHEPGESYTP